jgi:glycosyltransferase involved in cell wall biosynthesis
MNIFFVVNSRYPTQKAYGITTGYTAKAIEQLGYSVQIVAFSDSVRDEFGNKIYTPPVPNGIKKNSLNLVPERFRYYVNGIRIIRYLNDISSPKNEGTIYWVRDIYLFALIRLFQPTAKVLFENHRIMGKRDELILKILFRKNKCIVAGITQVHIPKYLNQMHPSSTLVLPMCAPDKFFEAGKNKTIQWNKKTLRICYIGKAFSSGNSNDLGRLINQIGEIRDINAKIIFRFIGIESKFINEIESTIRNDKNQEIVLQILQHVPHGQILAELEESDFGIVPYQNTAYNEMRFPIKIVEYAASKVLIIAADTKANRRVMSEKIAFFYDPQSKNGLETALKKILNEPDRADEKVSNALEWSRDYRYSNRANSAIKALVEQKWLDC